MDRVAERFLAIFQGHQDAWGGNEGRANYEKVAPELVQGHLDGTHEPIGIYPIRFNVVGYAEGPDQLRVRWGCCDIDTGDWNEAYRLAKTLQAMGLSPWVERSRSKGWHVWIFVTQSVAAYEMRRALKVAYAAIDLPAREANPKSELLRPNQLGNYVRLPFPGALAYGYQGIRQVMMASWGPSGDGRAMGLRGFLDSDIYSDPDKIRYWATKWYEPPRKLIVHDEIPEAELASLVARLPRPMVALYTNGPKPKEDGRVDTSQGLVALARNLAAKGWNTSDVFAVVAMADRRWGKYHERHDFESYIEDIVRRAF